MNGSALLQTLLRRRISFVLGAVLLATLALAIWRLGLSGEREDPIWTRIQREGVVRVGMDASFPPFEAVNEMGEFAGFDVDLTLEIARRLGIPHVQFVNIHFDGLYDALVDGKCDLIISALPYDPTMTQDVRYSAAYFDAGQMLLVREGETTIQGIPDLARKQVAVEMGSEAHYVARQLSSRRGIAMTLLTAYTSEEALDLLLAGEADAAIADAVTAYIYIGQRGGVRPAGERLTDEPYVIAMPLAARTLHARIDETLVAMTEDGYLETLRDKWF